MKITLIGSGNLATNIGVALKNAGHQIVQVYSHRLLNAVVWKQKRSISFLK